MSLATKNVNEEMEERLSVGDRLADRIAKFGGSWAFIRLLAFSFWWMIINTIQIWLRPFDEYPFIFLNLILSCIAASSAGHHDEPESRAEKRSAEG